MAQYFYSVNVTNVGPYHWLGDYISLESNVPLVAGMEIRDRDNRFIVKEKIETNSFPKLELEYKRDTAPVVKMRHDMCDEDDARDQGEGA